MNVFSIKWQRLVYDKDKTCERCNATGKEIRKATKKLKKALKPLNLKVELHTKALAPEECAEDISQSNRIWIGNHTLEEWLNAEVGESLCSTCCEEIGEEVKCRTIETNEEVYETVPSELIIQAGLLSAVTILNQNFFKKSSCVEYSKENSCCG